MYSSWNSYLLSCRVQRIRFSFFFRIHVSHHAFALNIYFIILYFHLCIVMNAWMATWLLHFAVSSKEDAGHRNRKIGFLCCVTAFHFRISFTIRTQKSKRKELVLVYIFQEIKFIQWEFWMYALLAFFLIHGIHSIRFDEYNFNKNQIQNDFIIPKWNDKTG